MDTIGKAQAEQTSCLHMNSCGRISTEEVQSSFTHYSDMAIPLPPFKIVNSADFKMAPGQIYFCLNNIRIMNFYFPWKTPKLSTSRQPDMSQQVLVFDILPWPSIQQKIVTAESNLPAAHSSLINTLYVTVLGTTPSLTILWYNPIATSSMPDCDKPLIIPVHTFEEYFVLPLRFDVLCIMRDKVCGISPGIVGYWISNVVQKVLNRALASDNCLDKEPKHGEHCQSPVLDLFHLQFCKCVRVICQSKWVEGTARVDLVKAFAKRTTTDSVSFNKTHEHNLDSPDCKNALGVDKVGIAKIVKSTLREDLSTSLEPDSLTEFDAVLCKDFGEDTAKRPKHCPAAVDHLKLTKCLPNALWSTLDGSAHGDAASDAANLADELILLLQCCLTSKCRPLNCRGSHPGTKT
ncbi:hypothetical protein RJ641_015142 [Dillenia turbinata]|uniref:Uncharacterized protein n=1 Tax=Dillenia turbinata TaxID=194707 RepID=A0AAN8ULT7_9MAGN